MVSCDTETTGIDHKHGSKPFFVSTCKPNENPVFWDWPVNPLNRQPIIPKGDVEAIGDYLFADGPNSPIGDPEREDGGFIFHNAKFDFQAMDTIGLWKNWDVTEIWKSVHDTLAASHLLASNRRHDLTYLGSWYLGEDIEPYEVRLHECVNAARRLARSKYPEWRIAKEDLPEMPSIKPGGKGSEEKPWKNDTWLPKALARELRHPDDHPWYRVTEEYACADAELTVKLWPVFRAELKRLDLWEIYLEKQKLSEILYEMSQHGITASRTRLDKTLCKFRDDSQALAEKCLGIARKRNFDLELPKTGNNKKLVDFCFNELKLPVLERSEKTGAPSLNKDVIEQYTVSLEQGSDGLEFISSLRGKRKLDTAVSYAESYLRFGRQLRPGWLWIYPNLNPTGTSTTRLSSSNPNGQNVCFDGETELLTTEGWVRADKLTKQHYIAQYWKDDGSVDFVHPVVHSPHFKGEMVQIKTEQQIDLLLTPEHRCLLQHRKSGKWLDCPAKDFKKDHFHFHAGTYVGGEKSLSYWEVVFVCAVQADGSYHKVYGEDYGIKLGFRRERKITRLRQCLNELEIKYTEKEERGGVVFYVHKDNYYNELVHSLMPDKQFGPWLLDFDRETLDLICEEIYFWDGFYTNKSAWSSSIIKNADWVQTLFTLSNVRASVSEYQPNTDWNSGLHYRVNTTRTTNHSGTDNHTKEFIPWDDKVYCVTVPSSYVLVRRNGKVSVTGNSKQEDYTLRVVFGPLPGREWWSIDYENIELRIPAYEAEEELFIQLFERPNDPPYFGSNHLLACHILHEKLFEECVNEEGEMDGRIFKNRYKATWYQYTKNGNFASLYGAMESSGTADRAYHVKGGQAKIASRLSKMDKLSKHYIRYAEKHGYVETLPDKTVNPRRGYPLLVARTEWGKVLPTTPLNYHVQGTAGWCNIKAMNRCAPYLKEISRKEKQEHRMVLTVHDELVFDFPKGGKKNLPKVLELKRLMEMSGDDVGIPLKASISYHPNNWGKEEKYED
jgi:DNA polymerase I-like protein with 3'-5' exonuclease and polymerase domains